MAKKRKRKQIRQRAAAKRARRKGKQRTFSEFAAEPGRTDFPDRRALERSLADIGRLIEQQEFDSVDDINAYLEEVMASGGVPSVPPGTPLEQAQDLMYDAWDASSARERVRLARQALEVSPDCADAYVLLAEETARNPREACDLYQKGVEAGERGLGEVFFEENVGHFWGILETRPYMRARAGLVQCLWLLGERALTVEHYRELLHLNPNDNQGNRYELLSCLLELGRDDEAEELFSQYEDDGATDWLYSRALVAFRRDGDNRKAQRYLREALQQNNHVPDYLLGRRRLPRSLPQYIAWGGEDEAVAYAVRFIKGWQQTPGALAWLAGQAA